MPARLHACVPGSGCTSLGLSHHGAEEDGRRLWGFSLFGARGARRTEEAERERETHTFWCASLSERDAWMACFSQSIEHAAGTPHVPPVPLAGRETGVRDVVEELVQIAIATCTSGPAAGAGHGRSAPCCACSWNGEGLADLVEACADLARALAEAKDASSQDQDAQGRDAPGRPRAPGSPAAREMLVWGCGGGAQEGERVGKDTADDILASDGHVYRLQQEERIVAQAHQVLDCAANAGGHAWCLRPACFVYTLQQSLFQQSLF